MAAGPAAQPVAPNDWQAVDPGDWEPVGTSPAQSVKPDPNLESLKSQGFLESALNTIKAPLSMVLDMVTPHPLADRKKYALQLVDRVADVMKNGTPEQRQQLNDQMLAAIPFGSTVYKAKEGNLAGAAGDIAGMAALGGAANAAGAVRSPVKLGAPRLPSLPELLAPMKGEGVNVHPGLTQALAYNLMRKASGIGLQSPLKPQPAPVEPPLWQQAGAQASPRNVPDFQPAPQAALPSGRIPGQPKPAPPPAAPTTPPDIAAQLKAEMEASGTLSPPQAPAPTPRQPYAGGAHEKRLDNAGKIADAITGQPPERWIDIAKGLDIDWPSSQDAQQNLIRDTAAEISRRQQTPRSAVPLAQQMGQQIWNAVKPQPQTAPPQTPQVPPQ